MRKFYGTLGLGILPQALMFKRGLGVAAAVGIGTAVSGIAGSAISSSASSSAAEKAKQAQIDTNATNLEIARQTNEANTANTVSTNATNIQLQREMNQFNIEQWNRNNKYNEWYYNQYESPVARRRQLESAGFNTAMFGPDGGKVNGYSASPVQQVSAPQMSIPNLVTPTIQNPEASGLPAKLQAYEELSRSFNSIGQNIESITRSQQNIANSKKITTENEFQRAAWDLDLGLKRSEIKQLTSSANALKTQADMNRQQIQESIAKIGMMDAQKQGQVIDNFYKGEFWNETVNKLKSECRFNDQQIEYIKQRLPVEIGLMKTQAALNRSQVALNSAQIAQCDAFVGLLDTQSSGQAYANQVMRIYGMRQASAYTKNLEKTGEVLESQKELNYFYMDDIVKYMDAGSRFLGGLGSALGGASQMKGKGAGSPLNAGSNGGLSTYQFSVGQ